MSELIRSTTTWVALLRAIGPATHKSMSMQDLRAACERAGLQNVATFIASGNLLFRTSLRKREAAKVLTNVLLDYQLNNAVILRKPAELKKVIAACPHPEAALNRPGQLLVVFFGNRLSQAAVNVLCARNYPERITALGRELCIDYSNGIARSKLTPAVIERTLGQPGTARNWNTLNKLIELAERMNDSAKSVIRSPEQ